MGYKNKDKQREYQRNWVRNNCKKYFVDKMCNNCGSKENLELHHLDPKMKISHRIWSWSEERRLQEFNKCLILCRACHKIETDKYFKYNQHGINLYNKGCKCVICRKSNADRSRNRRLKLKQNK
jgi:hypothetical protein